MKLDSKTLGTADLANANIEPSPKPISNQPRAAAGNELPGSEPARTRSAEREDVIDVEPQEQLAPRAVQMGRASAGESDATSAPLFENRDAEGLRARWNDIQVGFVDEPRAAVQKADSLVAETIKHLAESFAGSRRELEGEWDREGDVSTETLRVALQRYRSFFNRLLSI